MPGQIIPSLHERERIVRGLVMRLDDPGEAGAPGEAEQIEALESLLPFAITGMTFLLARGDTPPKHEIVDLARMAAVQRMLNALPTSYGLIRRHLYVEGIAASRPLVEAALLLELFRIKPERAKEWFEKPLSFISLGSLREEVGRERHDPIYSWLSEHGEHVTAAAFRRLALVTADTRKLRFSIGGRFDEQLQAESLAVLLIAASEASASLTDTFLHDLLRLSQRGRSAFVQLMKAGLMETTRRNAVVFASRRVKLPIADELLAQIDQMAALEAEEARKLENAGVPVPGSNQEF